MDELVDLIGAASLVACVALLVYTVVALGPRHHFDTSLNGLEPGVVLLQFGD